MQTSLSGREEKGEPYVALGTPSPTLVMSNITLSSVASLSFSVLAFVLKSAPHADNLLNSLRCLLMPARQELFNSWMSNSQTYQTYCYEHE